jgi:general secretion pathway protein G
MRNRGFTLVEILIVVVILGILAAIVVPQFTSASQSAVKGALQSQLQTIESQVELFRVRNQGSQPDDVAYVAGPPEDGGFDFGAANDGWGGLVTDQYLKEAPFNGFIAGDEGAQISAAAANIGAGEPADGTLGWGWDATAHEVFALGYNPEENLLSTEDDYVEWIPSD